jgi:hypothetical protein
MSVVETILWKSIPWAGHECARIVEASQSWRIEGAAVFEHQQQPCSLSYGIACSADWATQSVTVNGWVGSEEVHVRIEARDGAWTLNGASQPAVTGCIDVDLNFSPSTNVLPIRRLGLAPGESRDVRAAWLRFPSFALEPLEQRYTRVDHHRVRYESFPTNFSAELRVSAHGFVVDYEGIWSAVAQR